MKPKPPTPLASRGPPSQHDSMWTLAQSAAASTRAGSRCGPDAAESARTSRALSNRQMSAGLTCSLKKPSSVLSGGWWDRFGRLPVMVVVPELRLSHGDRVALIGEHCEFLASLGGDELDVDVAACPGWKVDDVVRHVAAFASSCRAWCERDDFGDTDPMAFNLAHMAEVQGLPLADLRVELDAYAACIASRAADVAVLGHLGVETAGWQSFHCASEFGMHRHDVQTALGHESWLVGDRAVDALTWTLDYAFPVVRHFRGLEELAPVRFVAPSDDVERVVGNGEPEATLSGSASELVLHLWRRPHGPVTIEGDPVAALQYTGMLGDR
jgi:uncharacterized protein (TIGR03083 family)